MIDNKKSIVVLDANAFISMVNIVDLGGKNRLITIKNVVDELKDEKSKGYFQRIPFEVEQLNFDDKSMLVVKEFARKTGDLTSLSDTDLQLLALTHTLYSRYMPEVVLRQNPPPMMENNEMDDSDTSGDNSESDEQGQSSQTTKTKQVQLKQTEVVQISQQNVVRIQQRTNEGHNEEEEQKWIKVPSTNRKIVENESSDQSDEQAWVTTSNYNKKMLQLNSCFKQQQQHKDQFSISLVSADFAIQNVASQIGIKLLSLDGRQITSLRRFVMQCYLCWKRVKVEDNKVSLCENCGYNSLSKIAYSIDKDGKMVLYRRRGWKPNPKVLQWKQRKLQQQEKKKKHQHQRRQPSIFETN